MARLAEIEVEEVSYVDKAANKRKFLFVKRDDSNEGGENLELLKQFSGDKEVIASLDGISANLEKLGKAIEDRLAKSEISKEDKEKLLAKKEQFEQLTKSINEGFEKLFLDKVQEPSEDGSEHKEKANLPAKNEGVMNQNSTGKDSESKPGMATEGDEEKTHSPAAQPSAEDPKLTSPGMKKADDELDAEDKAIVEKINACAAEFVKDAKEYQEMLSR